MCVCVCVCVCVCHHSTRIQKLVTSCRLAYTQISPTGFLPPYLPETVLAFCQWLCAFSMTHTLNTGDKGIVV